MHKKETHLQQMLSQLRTRLLVMFTAVGIAVEESSAALIGANEGKAQAVIDGDGVINDKENEIDELALSILVRNQPVAQDLRFVVAALRMVGELERIGDEAVDIAARTLTLYDSKHELEKDVVSPLLHKAKELFANALEAFKSLDSDLAIGISRGNNDFDQMEMKALNHVMNLIAEAEVQQPLDNPYGSESCVLTQTILIVRSFNRICHRSVNIAEQVYFISQGVNIKHKSINK